MVRSVTLSCMPAAHLPRTLSCPKCGLDVEIPVLVEGQLAECPRCEAVLARRCRGGWQKVGALSVAATMALVMALSGPFLELRSEGGDSGSYLLKAPFELGKQEPLLALVVGLLFFAIPILQTLGLVALSFAFLKERSGKAWTWLARGLSRLGPWGMADVFIVGTLVSLIKIVSIARVEFGVSFWAFIAFALLLSGAVASADLEEAALALEGGDDAS